MKRVFVGLSLAWGLFAFAPCAFSQTVKVEGMTVDLFLSGNSSDPTVMYFPGCNGRDTLGAKYQDFHVQKMADAWGGKVNIVRLQLVDDITHGVTDGMCFWSVEQNKKAGAESYDFAQKVSRIVSNWVIRQPWYNGNLHFFGFSYGGRVALLINFISATKGQFKTVTGIWPLCRKEYPIQANAPHTPTRLYATEKDPVSNISNCRSFYPNGGGDMIDVVTYPGSEHSWMTHPDMKYARVWWPNHKIWSESKYIEAYAEKTWASWVSWAKCKEGLQPCNP